MPHRLVLLGVVVALSLLAAPSAPAITSAQCDTQGRSRGAAGSEGIVDDTPHGALAACRPDYTRADGSARMAEGASHSRDK